MIEINMRLIGNKKRGYKQYKSVAFIDCVLMLLKSKNKPQSVITFSSDYPPHAQSARVHLKLFMTALALNQIFQG